MVETTDGELVMAAGRGDRGAFGRLYDRYRRMVHAVALARVEYADAGDVVQDTFLIALRRLATLRDPNAFGGWLLMIARNRATDYRRPEKPTSELPADLLRQSDVRRCIYTSCGGSGEGLTHSGECLTTDSPNRP